MLCVCPAAAQTGTAPFVTPPAAAPPATAAGNCDRLEFDLLRGTLNGVPPTASMDEVKRRLPCATGETPEGETINNGGGVFYTGHDFYFYTHRDYIEVRGRFPGTVTPSLMGRTAGAAMTALGLPERGMEGRGSILFRMPYGCAEVRMSRDGTQIEQVSAHARPCADVR